MSSHDGVPEAPLAEVGPAPALPPGGPPGSTREGELKTGTEVTFLPSPKTFTKTEFDFTTLEHRLRELAFLNSGVTLVLADLRGAEPKTASFHYDGGLEAFVNYLDRSKQVLHDLRGDSTQPGDECARFVEMPHMGMRRGEKPV